ncbi:MAG: PAS domain-containing protein [Treponema sp.]|jgi:two-component system phosphate regulon sensor histidine kinase PhoR|nr:PAS domain-containing protein [Treponema sp.]
MKTVFRQSLLVLSLTTLGLSLSFIVSVLLFMDGIYYETNTRSLLETARLLASSPDTITDLGNDTPYRITLIGADGSVRFDSRLAAENLENHRSRPEVAEALLGREGFARRNSTSLGMELVYAALPLYAESSTENSRENSDASPDAKQITGVFRLSVEVPTFGRRVSSAAFPFLVFAALLFLAAFALVFLFSYSLSRSFARLTGMAKLINHQETFKSLINSPRIMSDTREFIALENALKSMAAELSLRIETAQRESRRLQAILNGLSEGVFAVDEKGRLHLANRQARSCFGMAQDADITSLTLLEATRSAELDDIVTEVFAVTNTDARTGHDDTAVIPPEREITWYGEGVKRRFRVFAGPIDLGSSDIRQRDAKGAVMVLGDITRLHKLEQVRKDFAANVSHELRTPIQVVKGFAETLLDSPLDDKEQLRHCIGLIEKNALSMENLTNDLLSLVSLEDENSPKPQMSETDIHILLEESVRSVEAKARKKNIPIAVSCPQNLSAVLSGPLVVQALINLLDNGIKYSPQNSRLFLAAASGAGEIKITVKDEGAGIPPEHLGRIFERFYRVDKSRSQESGTGLGLAIVRHIALLHNGAVEVESHAGEGSVFTLRLKTADL